jgi:hypothetical protein
MPTNLSELRRQVRQKGLGAIDWNSEACQSIKAWKEQLERDLGGKAQLTAQQIAVIETAKRKNDHGFLKRLSFQGNMARPGRFELPTSCFGGKRSIQLSYGRQETFSSDSLAFLRRDCQRTLRELHGPAEQAIYDKNSGEAG